jgi:hypothetical protein
MADLIDAELQERIVERAAEKLFQELRTACNGDFRRLMILPTQIVAQLSGLSVRHIRRRFTTVPLHDNRKGVRLADYMDGFEIKSHTPDT